MLAISENRFNSVSALLGMILLFNVAAATYTKTIPSSVNPTNTNMSPNVPTTYSPSTTHLTVPTTNKPTEGPISCEYAIAKNVNITKFLGIWFEAARKTNVSSNQSCNDFDFKKENNHISVISTYSINPSKRWIHNNTCEETHVVEGVFNMTDNYGVSTFKILETDYTNYAFVCSYRVNNSSIPTIPTTTTTATPTAATPTTKSHTQTTNATTTNSETTPTMKTTTTTPSTTTASKPANSTTTTSPLTTTTTVTIPTTTSPTSTGTNAVFILVRDRSLSRNNTFMANLKTDAQYKYSDFKNLTTVDQSDECIKKNGASNLMAMFTMILAVVLAAVIKL